MPLINPGGAAFTAEGSGIVDIWWLAFDKLPGLVSLQLDGVVPGIDLQVTDCPNLATLRRVNAMLEGIDISSFAAKLTEVRLQENAIGEVYVDGVLAALDGNGLSNGYLDISSGMYGNNSRPSLGDREVTGTLTPDATGTYIYDGDFPYEPFPSFANGAGWYLWFDGMGEWVISDAKGSIENDHWRGMHWPPASWGTFEPYGGSGVATATPSAESGAAYVASLQAKNWELYYSGAL